MMNIIVLLCHLIPGTEIKSCHEEIAFEHMPMQACAMAQAGVAQWKANGKYSNEEWTVEGYKCASSGYVLKDGKA